MAARKPQRRMRVKAREYGEQQLEALGFEPKMEFELEDGSVVDLIHPWLWGDDVLAAYDEAKNSVEIARAVLGDDHERFIAGGGKSSQIVLAIELMKQRHAEASTDIEADPKGK